jgi:hypothetical protein
MSDHIATVDVRAIRKALESIADSLATIADWFETEDDENEEALLKSILEDVSKNGERSIDNPFPPGWPRPQPLDPLPWKDWEPIVPSPPRWHDAYPTREMTPEEWEKLMGKFTKQDDTPKGDE